MAFEFGLFTHIEKTSGSAALNRLYEEHLGFLAAAEQAGFWGFHLAEHHATALSMTPSPTVFLAAAAQRTMRIRLGALVYLLPFYNPLRFVPELCMLDHLSNGRLEIGVGRGISTFEHAFFGNPVLESQEVFDDAFAAMIEGLTSDKLTHAGPFFRGHAMPMVLKPMQKPYPGLWHGIISPHSAGFAGRHRMSAMAIGGTAHCKHILELYLEAARTLGQQGGALNAHVAEPRYGATRWLFIADSDQAAHEAARPAYEQFVANIQELWAAFGVRDLRIGHDYDSACEGGFMIVGSPAAAQDRLGHHIRALPGNYMLLNMNFGSLTAAQSRRSLELFATKVRPGLV
jgi:alkanesulfonate monooxygenase SsuD/methylene tetrahydromethanopterin reductase-like flavin-dependent oxidoreductase (luciferase family)